MRALILVVLALCIVACLAEKKSYGNIWRQFKKEGKKIDSEKVKKFIREGLKWRKALKTRASEEAEQEADALYAAISVTQLRTIMPNLSSSKANEYISHINNAMEWASINTCLRKSAFLAQLAHESAQLRYMEEIASGAAYEGRKDLGNTQPGDGKRYKGRGPIQLTGRANYRAAGKDLGVDLEGNPTLAATPEWGFKVAAWYWHTRSLNKYADSGSQNDFDIITKRINGGYNGKADRDHYWQKSRSALGC